MNKKLVILSIFILFILILFFIFFSNKNKKICTVKSVIKQNFETSLTSVGTIVPEDEVEIKATVSGIITKIFVEEGDFVKKGAPIINIITDKGTIRLKSTIDGKIIFMDEKIIRGLKITAGEHLFTIADTTLLKVKANINETDIYLIKVGQPVKISNKSFLENKIYGKVSKIGENIKEIDRISKIALEIQANFDEQRVIPGTKVDMEIITNIYNDVLQVPIESVKEIRGKTYVFVLNKNVIKKVPVLVGASNTSYIVISSDNLKEGTKVIVQSNFMLKDKVKVDIIR